MNLARGHEVPAIWLGAYVISQDLTYFFVSPGFFIIAAVVDFQTYENLAVE